MEKDTGWGDVDPGWVDAEAGWGNASHGPKTRDMSTLREEDADSGSARPDEWGSAVVSGDATKLAELVLVSSGSKPERALSILRDCVSLMEKEVAFSAPAPSVVPSPPTTSGRSHTSCLNALIVALNETCDGKNWHTSTKELQLASLDFCIVCRTDQTIHMKFETTTPSWLLAAAAAEDPLPLPKMLSRTRVPRLRARRVTWNLRTAGELRSGIFASADVDSLKFGRAFEGSLEAVAWPRRLKAIEFSPGSPFNKPIDMVEWPRYLQRLEFGCEFDQPLDRVEFPASLQRLLLHGFNRSIAQVALPTSMKQLHLLGYFDQPIDCVPWPPSLQQLRFGNNFNQSIAGIILPIEQAKFPASLQHLTFGSAFNQPIEDVAWPDSLQRLVVGDCFNHAIDNVRWPGSLQEVSFGRRLDSGADGRVLLLSEFNQRIGGSRWPSSLRRLTVGGDFRQSLRGLGTWMPNLESLGVLGCECGVREPLSHRDSLLRGIDWPSGLRELTVFKEATLDGVVIPSTVHLKTV
ncbi:unnamed protein product [Ectocarpus fasciculatus]